MSAPVQDVAVPADAPPQRPFSARLLNALHMFDRCRGAIALEWRSLHGIGDGALRLHPPTPAVPLAVLDLIHDGRGLRVAIVTRDGSTLTDLPAAFVCWRPATSFSAETGWRHAVAPEAQAAIREALAGFPLPPAFLVDGGHEVWAAWPLAHPLPVDRDPFRAIALLVALAERLDGDAATARDLMVPLCGVVRNWNSEASDLVDILDIEPARRYRVEDLEAALAHPQSAAEGTPRRKKGVPA